MVNFKFTYAPGVTLDQMVGFEVAGRIWSSYLTDAAEVNLYVEMTDRLADKILGGAIPKLNARQDYSSFRKSLEADATSADDQRALNATNTKEFDAWFDLYDGSNGNGNSNSGNSQQNNRVNLTSANSKALNITLKKGNEGQLDGYLLINKLSNQPVKWSYDYAQSQPPLANQVDFLSTVVHEIGHILGFTSSVDRSGWVSPRVNSNSDRKLYDGNVKERVQHATPLDLFRYSTDSNGIPDFSVGGNIFLSLTKGQQSLAAFSSGKDTAIGGDGSQASHWKGTPGSSGIMDPTLGLGERASIAGIDLRALDIIGWNINPQGANTPLNLTSFVSQAKQSLAQRLGTTVAGLESNPAAVQRITQDLTQEVLTLIENSEVYDKGARRPGDPFGQILDLFGLEGMFEEWMPPNLGQTGDRHSNQLLGTRDFDHLSGMAGHDQLIGKGGNDLMEGGKGRDRLVGGNGNDVLAGGRGSDLLIGGNGRDLFMLRMGVGLDVIQDFQDGKDFLGLSDAVKAEGLSIGQAGKDTAIAWQGEAIALLKGVSASQISTADFVVT